MKKIIAVLMFCLLIAGESSAQLYMTRTGYVSFFSHASMEDIKAENKQLYAVINVEKKELAFVVLMKGFQFRKELMQTHFNSNYIESDTYPKANFTGTYSGDVDMKSGTVSNLQVNGVLTLHGVSKQIEVPATLQFLNGVLVGNTVFKARPEDYNIKIPLLVRNNIGKEVEVTIKVDCNPKN
ncbi:MAG: YceI family protein [Ginsengibacter sp.]